jgi:transposase
MMGHQQVEQAALFYEFSLERHVPANHLLRSIDRFVELGELRRELSAFYSTIGRPSIAPELMIRMLLVGYCFGIRSERRLCEEVHLNLAYRWFCRLGLDGDVPDHSTFSKIIDTWGVQGPVGIHWVVRNERINNWLKERGRATVSTSRIQTAVKMVRTQLNAIKR